MGHADCIYRKAATAPTLLDIGFITLKRLVMYNIKVNEVDLKVIDLALNHYYNSLAVNPVNDMITEIRERIRNQQDEQRESVLAFEAAITAGILSNDEAADNFAGRYMWMGEYMVDELRFKHIMTREYVYVKL